MSAGSAHAGKMLEVLPCVRTMPDSWRKVAIVLPAYAWRSVAHYRVRSDRDPFKHSVLRLAGAGVVDHERIASLLGLHAALVHHVQVQCFNTGLLDNRSRLTVLGERRLKERETFESEEDVQPGFLFREALTGEVLPLFHSGSLPAPDRRPPTGVVLPFSDRFSGRPAPRAVAVACRSCRRLACFKDVQGDVTGLHGDMVDPEDKDARDAVILDDFMMEDWARLTDDEPVEGDEEEGMPLAERAPVHVSIISVQPQEVGLEIFCYTLPDNPDIWYARAPIGASGGWWYKRRLEWAAEHDASVRSVIDNLLLDANQSRSLSPGLPVLDDAGGLLSRLESCQATAPVARAWHRACEARRLLTAGEDVGDLVVVRCQNALETLLKMIIRATPNADEVGHLIGRTATRKLVREMIENLGQLEVPDSFVSPTLWARAASVHGHLALRDRAAFLLFAAGFGHSSIFAAACYTNPDLLQIIDEVARSRNEQAHAGAGSPMPQGSGPAKVMDECVRVIQTFLPYF